MNCDVLAVASVTTWAAAQVHRCCDDQCIEVEEEEHDDEEEHDANLSSVDEVENDIGNRDVGWQDNYVNINLFTIGI